MPGLNETGESEKIQLGPILPADYNMAGENFFFGIKLDNKDDKVVPWKEQINRQNLSRQYENYDHRFVLRNAVLGKGAKGSHIIEAETETGNSGEKKKIQIVHLTDGFPQNKMKLEFNEETVFHLIEGSGPVFLSGEHTAQIDAEYMSSDDEEEGSEVEEEDGEDEEIDEEEAKGNIQDLSFGLGLKKAKEAKEKASPAQTGGQKRKKSDDITSGGKKAKTGKKAKDAESDEEPMEDEEEEEKEAEDVEDNEEPEPEPEEAPKAKKKVGKGKKGAAAAKKKATV